MVDDPSSLPDEFPTEEAQETERQRLFRIIEDLVKWENTTNEAVLHVARVEIARSAARNHSVSLPRHMAPAEVAAALKQYAPPVLDPFAGGGSIPLEAQRLGLEAYASDLNPVAVLINKALIEIPPKFAGCPPVNPESRREVPAQGVERRRGTSRRRPLLWQLDAERSVEVHRASLPKGVFAQGVRKRRGDGDCLALGAHGHVS